VAIALDEKLAGDRDGKVDHLFLFESRDELPLGNLELTGDGTLEFWHDGLRLSIPELGEVLQLEIRETNVPRLVRGWAAPSVSNRDGVGLVQRTGGDVGRLPIDDAARDFFAKECDYAGCDIDYQDYSGVGGSGSGCAASCACTAGNGNHCSASCGGSRCASCSCTATHSACGCT